LLQNIFYSPTGSVSELKSSKDHLHSHPSILAGINIPRSPAKSENLNIIDNNNKKNNNF